MEFKRRIDLRQSFGHCEDRRDAYAAGEQDASARVARKREQVARLADGEGVALLYSIMHDSRPTTGVWNAEYRDEIAVRLTGHVAPPILPHEFVHRKCVVSGKRASVRGEAGGRRIIKKKNTIEE